MSTRGRSSRDLRSQSPVKQDPVIANRPKATPRSRKPKKPVVAEVANSIVESGDDEYVPEGEEEEAATSEKTAEDIADVLNATTELEEAEALNDNAVRVSVTEDVIPGEGDTETTRTTVKVELPINAPDLVLPTDTEGVVEIARDIVDSAKALQEGATETDSLSTSKKSLKRKAETLDEDDVRGPEEIIEEIADGEASDLASGAVEMHERAAKRTRIMVPAEEYRREKAKRRALMGVSGALAVGIMIPFLSNLPSLANLF